jgi:hypothetical protein
MRAGAVLIRIIPLALLPPCAAAQEPPTQAAIAQAAQALAQAQGQATPTLPIVLGFILFVALVCFGIGRYVWQLRRDYLDLMVNAPREPGATTDRLSLYRDSPFGLPEGSIRGIIAVAIVLVALPAMVLNKALGMATTGELGTILGGVLGFYFGSRNAGGDAEAARRQADRNFREAQAARAAQSEAEQQAEAAAQTAVQASARAEEVASTAQAQAGATGQAASRLTELTQRAAEGVAVARAIAGLLPAGPAATVLTTVAGTAGTVIQAATGATGAIQDALRDPSGDNVSKAVEAATAALRAAGEGTEVAQRLGGALDLVRQASGAIGAVTAAVNDPSPARVLEALAQANGLLAQRSDGGLGNALAPALGVLGTVMKLPGVAGLLGAATPVGAAGAVLLGAWQAAQLGNAHYRRWMARVLDRPVSRDLFPGGEWDGEAARELLMQVPALAIALDDVLGPEARQQDAAEALRRLLESDAPAWLFARKPGAFASQADAEAAVATFRRKVLEDELDRTDRAPVAISADAQIAQARLREDLDRLREAGAGGAIDTLALLADGVINARPQVPGGGAAVLDVPDLMRRALATAAEEGRKLERPPPPTPPEPA